MLKMTVPARVKINFNYAVPTMTNFINRLRIAKTYVGKLTEQVPPRVSVFDPGFSTELKQIAERLAEMQRRVEAANNEGR